MVLATTLRGWHVRWFSLIVAVAVTGCGRPQASTTASPMSSPPTRAVPTHDQSAPTGLSGALPVDASGCPVMSPIPTTTVGESQTVPSGATSPTPVSSSSYVPSVSLTPGPIDLGSIFSGQNFRMLTPEQGWAVGPPTGPAAAVEAVLKTEDGGSHWRNVTPPGFSPSFGVSQWMAYFLDVSHAWVAFVPATRQYPPLTAVTITIYRTVDAARTWQTASFTAPEGQVELIDFADQLHGWIPYLVTNGGIALYRTTDGGIHWDCVGGVPAPPPPCQSLLPFFSFSDASTGWAAGRCYQSGGSAYFQVSYDGGRTWQPLALPHPNNYPDPCPCMTYTTLPTFTSSQDGWFTLSVGTETPVCDPNGDCTTNPVPKLVIVYATDDAGKTWLPVTLPAPAGTVAFADNRDGFFAGRTLKPGATPPSGHELRPWETSFAGLWMTSDGGRTWTNVPTDANLPPGKLQFVTASTGWFSSDPTQTGQGPVTNHPVLFRTVDGGHSWQQLTPMLIG